MRCCASPTICSVDSADALRAGTMIEAMLLAPVLRPAFAGVEPFGEYEISLLARDVAQRDRSGFAALVAAGLEGPR